MLNWLRTAEGGWVELKTLIELIYPDPDRQPLTAEECIRQAACCLRKKGYPVHGYNRRGYRFVPTLALLLFLAPVPVLAHGEAEWILQGNYKDKDSISCCGPTDCKRLRSSAVQDRPGGYEVAGQFVSEREAFQSIDEDFWLCVKSDGTVRCLFVPSRGA